MTEDMGVQIIISAMIKTFSEHAISPRCLIVLLRWEDYDKFHQKYAVPDKKTKNLKKSPKINWFTLLNLALLHMYSNEALTHAKMLKIID